MRARFRTSGPESEGARCASGLDHVQTWRDRNPVQRVKLKALPLSRHPHQPTLSLSPRYAPHLSSPLSLPRSSSRRRHGTKRTRCPSRSCRTVEFAHHSSPPHLTLSAKLGCRPDSLLPFISRRPLRHWSYVVTLPPPVALRQTARRLGSTPLDQFPFLQTYFIPSLFLCSTRKSRARIPSVPPSFYSLAYSLAIPTGIPSCLPTLFRHIKLLLVPVLSIPSSPT